VIKRGEEKEETGRMNCEFYEYIMRLRYLWDHARPKSAYGLPAQHPGIEG